MGPSLERKRDQRDVMNINWKVVKNKHNSGVLRKISRGFTTFTSPVETVVTVRKYFNF